MATTSIRASDLRDGDLYIGGLGKVWVLSGIRLVGASVHAYADATASREASGFEFDQNEDVEVALPRPDGYTERDNPARRQPLDRMRSELIATRGVLSALTSWIREVSETGSLRGALGDDLYCRVMTVLYPGDPVE